MGRNVCMRIKRLDGRGHATIQATIDAPAQMQIPVFIHHKSANPYKIAGAELTRDDVPNRFAVKLLKQLDLGATLKIETNL